MYMFMYKLYFILWDNKLYLGQINAILGNLIRNWLSGTVDKAYN